MFLYLALVAVWEVVPPMQRDVALVLVASLDFSELVLLFPELPLKRPLSLSDLHLLCIGLIMRPLNFSQ